MELFFYLAAAVATSATIMTVTATQPVHALLYLVLSLLAVSGVFFTLGAPFAGVLEVIVYAGAIMVLFVFVVMMLNLGTVTTSQEKRWFAGTAWLGAGGLAALLLAGLLYALWMSPSHPAAVETVGPKVVGAGLFGAYLLAVELASLLLTAAMVAAWHLGRHE